MTNEEINVAVAKACGWKTTGRSSGVMIRPDSRHDYPPDYGVDLNAIHEAEKIIVDAPETIQNDARRVVLACWLQQLSGYKPAYHATAPQRCEAFLRTLELWRLT